jgi:hypothetical protein
MIRNSDDLNGTSVYGLYDPNPTSTTFFSIPFTANVTTRFLFVTGDEKAYIITTHDSFALRTTGSTHAALDSELWKYSENSHGWPTFCYLKANHYCFQVSRPHT